MSRSWIWKLPPRRLDGDTIRRAVEAAFGSHDIAASLVEDQTATSAELHLDFHVADAWQLPERLDPDGRLCRGDLLDDLLIPPPETERYDVVIRFRERQLLSVQMELSLEQLHNVCAMPIAFMLAGVLAERLGGELVDNESSLARIEPLRQLPPTMPLLTVRTLALLPGWIGPIDIGRPASLTLVRDAIDSGERVIAVAAQRDAALERPRLQDLHPVACAARILEAIPLADDNISLFVQGEQRVRLDELVSDTPYLRARVTAHREQQRLDLMPLAEETLRRSLALGPRFLADRETFDDIAALPPLAPGAICDMLAAHADFLDSSERRIVLDTLDAHERLSWLYERVCQRQQAR